MLDKATEAQEQGLAISDNQDISTAAFSKWSIYDSQDLKNEKDLEVLRKCKAALNEFYYPNMLKTLVNELTIYRSCDKEISKELHEEIGNIFNQLANKKRP